MLRRRRSRLIYASCCAVAIAAFAPAAAGAALTPTVKAPKLTTTSNAPMLEGNKRTVTVTHTCRAKKCEITIFTRPGTAVLTEDYLFTYKKPARFIYSRDKKLTTKVQVSALRDKPAEPRESLVVYASVRARDGANEQQIEGKKTLYILNAPPPSRYASIFLDKTTAKVGYGYGYATLRGARNRAENQCVGTCEEEVWVRNGCAAVYKGALRFGSASAATRAAAKAQAYANAGGAPAAARLIVSVCTG